MRKFKKIRHPEHLELAKSFTNLIKKAIKKECRRNFQLKAKSPNPKHFWEAVNLARGKYHEKINEIEVKGVLTNNQLQISNSFANFFRDKVHNLSNGPIRRIELTSPSVPITFSETEVATASKGLSNKKSYGTDKIPQNFFKDCVPVMLPGIKKILNLFAKDGIPPN